MIALSARPRRLVVVAAALSVLLVLTGMLLFTQQAAVGAPSAPTVALVVRGPARVGEPLTIQVVATGVRNLAGFQSTLAFDPAQLQVQDVAIADELKASGRDLLPLGPVFRPGAVVLGAVTCPVDQCNTARYTAKDPARPGVGGRVVLAELVVEPAAAGQLQLRLEGVQVVDPQGGVLPVGVTHATLDVAAR